MSARHAQSERVGEPVGKEKVNSRSEPINLSRRSPRR